MEYMKLPEHNPHPINRSHGDNDYSCSLTHCPGMGPCVRQMLH